MWVAVLGINQETWAPAAIPVRCPRRPCSGRTCLPFRGKCPRGAVRTQSCEVQSCEVMVQSDFVNHQL